ncbi:MAG: hypothetical protein V4819_26280 [Verrucomicrobiota bacterium]
MFSFSRPYSPQAVVFSISVSILTAYELGAQNFTIRSGYLNPFGVNGPLPFGKPLDTADGIGLKGGFNTAISLNSAYDSNFLQSENDPESEFSLSLTPSVFYTSDPEGGARIVMTGGYTPSANVYLNNSDFSGVDQSGNVSLIVSGSRTTISAYAGYGEDSGTDRFAGGFLTGSALSVGLQGSYQLAPRTSISAGWSSAITEYGGEYGENSAVGFNGHSVNLGGFWAATERFGLGPSLTYSTDSSDNTGGSNSWGASLQANYKAAERIQLSGSLGTQYSVYSRESGSGGFNLTGSFNASWQIDEIWSWSGSIQSGIVPSPIYTNYVINSWSISSSLNRSLSSGSAGLGLNMDFSNFESVGPTGGVTQDAQENVSLFLNYSRPLFRDRVGFNASIQYTLNSGDSDWQQILLSAGLSKSF